MITSDDLLSQLTLLERKSLLSTRFGNLYISPKDLQSTAALYTERPAFFAEGDGRSVSFSGSSSMIHYKGRFLSLCTKHQFRNQPVDSICLRTTTSERYVSANRYVFANPQNASIALHRHDLCFFDFTTAVNLGDITSQSFYSLDASNSIIQESEKTCMIILSGFPFADDKISYTLSEKYEGGFRLDAIHGKKRILVCKLEKNQTDDEIFILSRAGDTIAEPNGMSGGPAFALQSNGNDFFLRFAGIIIAGGKEVMRILRAKFVMEFLDAALQDE